jgi:cysteinyl-tRNA synthetase
MTIKFFNNITKQLEDFIPQKSIKIYCCGPTVYDDIHIGNSRPIIIFDALACFLKNYYKDQGIAVEYVRNITDIDEKIINKVIQGGFVYKEFIQNQIKNFLSLMENFESFATKNIRVTDHVIHIIEFIQLLIHKELAYVTDQGNVYFNTKKCPVYQCLSGAHRQNEESISVINESDKIHWEDFALWKRTLGWDHIHLEGNQYYQGNSIFWSSPWGNGVPGWHIECSTIIRKYLGDTIDIHGGGQDLIFPHHDNEIAQCWAINNEIFCKYWLHNGMVLINGKKMAKSTGNFIQLKDVVQDKDTGNILKYLILSTHYRQPLNFSQQKLLDAQNNVKKIKNFFSQYGHYYDDDQYQQFHKKNLTHLLDPMAQDFNTVQGLNEVHRWIKQFKAVEKIGVQWETQQYFFNVIFILESFGLNLY